MVDPHRIDRDMDIVFCQDDRVPVITCRLLTGQVLYLNPRFIRHWPRLQQLGLGRLIRIKYLIPMPRIYVTRDELAMLLIMKK